MHCVCVLFTLYDSSHVPFLSGGLNSRSHCFVVCVWAFSFRFCFIFGVFACGVCVFGFVALLVFLCAFWAGRTTRQNDWLCDMPAVDHCDVGGLLVIPLQQQLFPVFWLGAFDIVVSRTFVGIVGRLLLICRCCLAVLDVAIPPFITFVVYLNYHYVYYSPANLIPDPRCLILLLVLHCIIYS